MWLKKKQSKPPVSFYFLLIEMHKTPGAERATDSGRGGIQL